MNTVRIFPDKHELAARAAELAVRVLRRAIATHGQAVWVLAGGTTPDAAYRAITKSHLDALDWSLVTFVMGDERIGPLDGPDNNWHAAEQALLQRIPQATFLRPHSDLPAEQAANDYARQLEALPKTTDNLPRFDLVWLGMGPDGHTLSLFPNHPDFNPTDKHLVVAIHNSPKPPAERISLSLRALESAQSTVILAAGADKSTAITSAQDPTSQLPIAQASRITNAIWMADRAATS